MGFFDFLLPTPASHAIGVCRAMNIAFNVQLEKEKKQGKTELTFGEIAKRALITRPGWELVNATTFRNKRNGELFDIDVVHDSLADVVKRVVAIETPIFLMHKRKLSEQDVELAIRQAVEAVDKYFSPKKK